MFTILRLLILFAFFIVPFSCFAENTNATDISSILQELAALKIEVQKLRNEVDQLKASQQQAPTTSKSTLTPDKSICSQCRGTGKRFVICAVCNGTGIEISPCKFCNSRGKNGNNICNACKGKGTMQRTCMSCSTWYSGPETRGQNRRDNFEVCSFCGGTGKK